MWAGKYITKAADKKDTHTGIFSQGTSSKSGFARLLMSIRRTAAWNKRQLQTLVTLLSYRTPTTSVPHHSHRNIRRSCCRDSQPLALPSLGLNVLVE